MEMPLHVIVKVSGSRINQPTVVGIVIPIALVIHICGLASSHDDTSIRPGNQIIVVPCVEAERIRRPQRIGWWLGHSDVAAGASNGDNRALVFRSNSGRIRIAGKDNPFTADRTPRCGHCPPAVDIRSLGD